MMADDRKETKSIKSYICNWTEKQYNSCFHFIDFESKYSELISKIYILAFYKESLKKCNIIMEMSIRENLYVYHIITNMRSSDVIVHC